MTAAHRFVGDHAVICGASLAGLLTARVLADHYREVTLVERDELPATGEHRRGIPHGRHLHGLHPRGREILDELFPGFTDAAVAAGAVRGDVQADVRWCLSGYRLARAHSGLPGLFASRPFLEGHVRERVRALSNVTIVERATVIDLVATADRRRVTGIRIDDGEPRELPADLVVDATGRGSRVPDLVTALGYEPPEEDRVEIRLGYATRNYRLRPGATDGDGLIMTARTLDNPRSGVIAATEGGRHMLTLVGILGDRPPTDADGFEAFAATLAAPDIAEVIRDAEPLDDPVPFGFPASVRRRYERLERWPDGLLVIGDAVCSFNPVYGQGMTAAGLEVIALRNLLAGGREPSPRRYFAAIARVVDVPWQMAVGADLAHPGVPGRRTAKVRMINAYLRRYHAAAARDPKLTLALLRVIGLLERPESLLRPDRAARVFASSLGPSGGPPRTETRSRPMAETGA